MSELEQNPVRLQMLLTEVGCSKYKRGNDEKTRCHVTKAIHDLSIQMSEELEQIRKREYGHNDRT